MDNMTKSAGEDRDIQLQEYRDGCVVLGQPNSKRYLSLL